MNGKHFPNVFCLKIVRKTFRVLNKVIWQFKLVRLCRGNRSLLVMVIRFIITSPFCTNATSNFVFLGYLIDPIFIRRLRSYINSLFNFNFVLILEINIEELRIKIPIGFIKLRKESAFNLFIFLRAILTWRG